MEVPRSSEDNHSFSVFASNSEREDIDGIDRREVCVFDASPVTQFEQKHQDFYELTAELDRQQELYSALQFELMQISPAMKRMVEMREAAELDYRQVSNELLVVEREQMGPPRRLPTAAESQATHARKQRLRELAESIDSFQSSIDGLEGKRLALEKQMLGLARTLAVLRTRCKGTSDELGAGNQGLGHLPVVVGKGLANISGFPQNNPMDIYDTIVSKSKVFHIEEHEAAAMKEHSDRVQTESLMWVARQEKAGVKEELNATLSRLAEISGRLQQAFSGGLKSSIVEALNAFFESNIELTAVHHRVGGPIDWLAHSTNSQNIIENISTRDNGCIYFEEDSNDGLTETTSTVTLGEELSGSIEGFFRFPKLTTWVVSFTISNDTQNNLDGLLSSDNIRVRMGPTESAMSLIGTYFNVHNLETNAILYEVKYVIRATTLAYQFEFQSSTKDMAFRLGVNRGGFTEYLMDPMEVSMDSRPPHRVRVISSYIKNLRVQETQGKLRLTRLLEELIQVESSQSRNWDSSVIFTNSRQRYNRNLFERILRAEILVELRRIAIATKADNAANIGDDKLRLSQEGYLSRRRKSQEAYIAKCMNEVHKRLDVYDESQQQWRHVYVIDCVLKWIENGTVAQVTHIVQEYDEQNSPIGSEYECNLANARYFIAAKQTFDESAKISFQERRRWEERIQRLEREGEERIQQAMNEVSAFKASKQEELQREYHERWSKEEGMERSAMPVYLSSPIAKAAIDTEFENLLYDMRRGLLTIDAPSSSNAEKSMEKQLRSMALARVADKKIAERKHKFEAEFQDRIAQVESEVDERLRVVETRRQALARIMQQETALFRDFLRSKRDALLSRARFDPIAFQSAVPQATSCEHEKTKAWGTFYGKGVRCTICSKELTQLHLEESQYLGYGSGMDPNFNKLLLQHRQNEASFRFQSCEELEMVESERLRLEKERRVMELNEIYFYDYDKLRGKLANHISLSKVTMSILVIHEFDRRHNIRKEEEENLRQASIRMLHNDEPLNIEDPPPTFRAQDERKRAQFAELLFTMGRIQVFHRKIDSLKEERLVLLNERAKLADQLKSLHQSSFRYDNEMARLERDLNRCINLLNTKQTVVNLFNEAKKVLERAKKDKRSAEARFAGKWDDVKEAADALDFIHDDTRALLRHKFLCDLKLQTQSEEVERLHDVVAHTKTMFESYEARVDSLLYCRPGNRIWTRYGEGLIRGYRDRDGMLLVTLRFGRPPAKLWITGEEVMWACKARQQAERLLMAQEDDAMQTFLSEERTQMKRELFAMRLEESLTRQVAFKYRKASSLDAAINQSVDIAIKKGEKLIKKKKIRELLDGQIEAAVKSRYDQLMEEYRTYDGPPSGAPKKPTMLSLYNIRRDMHIELREKYLAKIALEAERDVIEENYRLHIMEIQEQTISTVIDDSIEDMIHSIAEEALREGRAAKSSAERASGLIIPHPAWMQFDTYASLIDLVKRKRAQLKAELQLVMGALAKVDAHRRSHPDPIAPLNNDLSSPRELTDDEMDRKLEMERQKLLCDQMAVEEEWCRRFYKWELLENLRERRAMREEESAMRELIREERAMEAAQDKSYAVTSTMLEEQQKQYKLTSFDKRRMELKALTLERGRQAEETAYMTLEDARSKLLRDIDKAERMRRQYEKEFGIIDEPDDNVEEVPQEEGVHVIDVTQFETVRVPSWMEVPEGWENWLLAQQKDYVKRAKSVRQLTKRLNRNLLIEERRMQKFQNKNLLAWEELYLSAVQKKLESELQVMDMEQTLQVNVKFALFLTAVLCLA